VTTLDRRTTIPVMRPWLGREEAQALEEVISTGWIAQGPRVQAFEEAFASAVGAAHAVAVSSCTTGLHLALVVAGVGPGDEVIVPSLSFIASANAVRYVGATPVFADVDLVTGNVTPETLAAVASPRTKAVMVVHQAGVPADVTAITAWARPLGLAVIEDAACAIGSTHADRLIGAHSDLVVFSFHPRKILTTGEGGMVTTSRADWSDRLRSLREHGTTASAATRHGAGKVVIEEYGEVGFNYRMTDLQAAVGLVQLGRLGAVIARRRALANRYQEALADLASVTTVADPAHGTTNFQSFWVRLRADFPMDRNELLAWLLEDGISARRGIMASHLEPAYAGCATAPLEVTELLTANTIILPLFHEMSEDDQDRVVESLRKAGESGGAH
jgi:dTDP-4-amino-4,6-dideoxygalactose transaminase